MKRWIQAGTARVAQMRDRLPSALNEAIFHMPTRAVDRTDILCREQGWRWRALGEIQSPSLREHGDASDPAISQTPFVAELPGGRVLGSACTAIAAPGLVLADVSPDPLRPLHEHRLLRTFAWAPSPRHLVGTSGLLGASGRQNYYHWLFDMLPRLGMIEQFHDLARVDHWIAPATRLPVVPELLAKCGVPAERVRWLGRFSHVRCDQLIVTAEPSPMNGSVRRSVEFLRSRFIVAESARRRPSRRILLLRRATRRLLNLQELQPLIDRLGLEPTFLEGMSIEGQMALFSEAQLVVGIHGAGLSNIAFMPEGAGVVEILPSWYRVEFFSRLARDAGLRFARVVGDPAIGGRGRKAHADLRVDPEALAAAIDGLPSSGR